MAKVVFSCLRTDKFHTENVGSCVNVYKYRLALANIVQNFNHCHFPDRTYSVNITLHTHPEAHTYARHSIKMCLIIPYNILFIYYNLLFNQTAIIWELCNFPAFFKWRYLLPPLYSPAQRLNFVRCLDGPCQTINTDLWYILWLQNAGLIVLFSTVDLIDYLHQRMSWL